MGRALTGSESGASGSRASRASARDAAVRSPGALPPSPFRRIILVGFMGSGKTTIGRLLARALGWKFVDLDDVIEHEEGRKIPRIFDEDGEDGFRLVEHDLAQRFLVQEQVVLAPGGGWPCREGRLDEIGPDTLSIWLRVSSRVALERVRGQGTRRPLLEVPDPLRRIEELLAEREAHYRKAMWRVDTERHSPSDVVERITERLRTDPERPLLM